MPLNQRRSCIIELTKMYKNSIFIMPCCSIYKLVLPLASPTSGQRSRRFHYYFTPWTNSTIHLRIENECDVDVYDARAQKMNTHKKREIIIINNEIYSQRATRNNGKIN